MPEAEAELKKIPFFVRKKARRNTEAFAAGKGLAHISVETFTMQKRTTAGSALKVVIVTLDHHLASAVGRVNASLAKVIPGFSLSLHAASDWAARPASLESLP